MNPFIDPEVSGTGKKLLRIQWEGIDAAGLSELVRRSKIIAIKTPDGQIVKATWRLRVSFDNGEMLELSSACTMLVDWQEFGSLNVRKIENSKDLGENITWSMQKITPTKFQGLHKIIYENDDVISECGLIFYGSGNDEIIVSTGVPPFSVTASSPFLRGNFEPEFPFELCRRDKFID